MCQGGENTEIEVVLVNWVAVFALPLTSYIRPGKLPGPSGPQPIKDKCYVPSMGPSN